MENFVFFSSCEFRQMNQPASQPRVNAEQVKNIILHVIRIIKMSVSRKKFISADLLNIIRFSCLAVVRYGAVRQCIEIIFSIYIYENGIFDHRRI